MPYQTKRSTLRPHALPALRAQWAQVAGGVAGTVAQLRRRRYLRDMRAMVLRGFDLGITHFTWP